MSLVDVFDNLNNSLFNVGTKSERVVLYDVPFEWSPFGAIKGDSIKRIDTGNDKDMLLLYRCPKGVFPKHFHPSDEIITVIRGLMAYETYKGIFEVKSKDQITIKKGIHHIFTFQEDDNLLSIYYPDFSDKWIAK